MEVRWSSEKEREAALKMLDTSFVTMDDDDARFKNILRMLILATKVSNNGWTGTTNNQACDQIKVG